MNTQKIMEELTIEQFAASVLWELHNSHELPVRWLCASNEHKKERMTLLQKEFEKWRDDELKMKQKRERGHV